MQRILIIGGPGGGKSTLTRALMQKLDLPVTHLDQIWWTPGWIPRDLDDYRARLSRALQSRVLPLCLELQPRQPPEDCRRARRIWGQYKTRPSEE
ncbi:MAG: hypothetical protein WA138_12715 [Parvibaculum sp.]